MAVRLVHRFALLVATLAVHCAHDQVALRVDEAVLALQDAGLGLSLLGQRHLLLHHLARS